MWSRLSDGDTNKLDLDHLSEWSIDIIDSTPNLTTSVLQLDHLSCVSDGKSLLETLLKPRLKESETLPSNEWSIAHFNSNKSEENSLVRLQDDGIHWSYLVERVEAWGGYQSIQHLAPANSYYNFSAADSIEVKYKILSPATPSDEVHLRLQLMDARDCIGNCTDGKNHEVYYSFQHVLDIKPDHEDLDSFLVPLVGDNQPSSPFFRPGWSGMEGNNVLDADMVKAISFEINIRAGDIGKTVTGGLLLDSIVATVGGENVAAAASMIQDDNIDFYPRGDSFQLVQFKGGVCDQVCEADESCQYAFRGVIEQQNCWIASSLNTDNIQLASSGERFTFAYWKDNEKSRGDFCDRCKCNKARGLVDCRGKNLTSLPKTLRSFEDWSPVSLDLRDNAHLVYIGEEALSSQTWTVNLEEIYLPSKLVYIERGNILKLPSLKNVFVEQDEDRLFSGNVASRSDEAFTDVCCETGSELVLDDSRLAFCDVSLPSVGDDAFYEPFYTYIGVEELKTLSPTSSFQAEASESAQKCAEACDISNDCAYFRYDARFQNSAHTCTFLGEGTVDRTYTCCVPEDYSDEEQTSPGFTSGWAAKTRHELGNARVLASSLDHSASPSNGYSVTMEFKLGANPLRGAVWVTPEIVTETASVVEFHPRRVAIYDNTTVAKITVKVLQPKKETLIIFNEIHSCDSAFTSGAANDGDTNLLLSVDPPEDTISLWVIIASSIAGLALVLVFVAYMLLQWKKRQNDNLWIVKHSELKFDDPLVVAGRGTFGMVLVAEYRGTQVAVKKVLPATSNDGASSGTMSMTNRGGGSTSFLFSGTTTRGMVTKPNDKAQMRTDFMKEMRQLAKLRHPCVTTIMGKKVKQQNRCLVTCSQVLTLETTLRMNRCCPRYFRTLAGHGVHEPWISLRRLAQRECCG